MIAIGRRECLEGFDSVTVGIFGLGSIGSYVAEHLVELGFRVKGFATTYKSVDGVDVYSGDIVTDSILQSSRYCGLHTTS